MNPSRRIATLASSACAVAMLCAAASASAQDASAQEVLKQVDGEARTTLSDKPPPRKTAVLPRRGGKVDISEAARRLECAQLAREEGIEPRAGEFTPVGDMRAVNYRYWKRQEKLRLAVEQAQRRSQDTVRIASRGQVKVSQI